MLLSPLTNMVRDNHVVLSDDEHESLVEIRREVYKSDSVPMGEVIQFLIEEAGYSDE